MLRFFSVLFLVLSVNCFAQLQIPPSYYAALKKNSLQESANVLWVDAKEQAAHHFQNKSWQKSYVISTGKNGLGELEGSEKTPRGLHKISEKLGSGAAPGTVFVARQATGKVFRPGDKQEKDLVLTRILWLEGLENSLNKGRDSKSRLVDSKKRYIYIHGTNYENLLGTPASKGCVRMQEDDIIEIFEKFPLQSHVWIE